MAYTTNTNIPSLQSQEYLRMTTEFQSKTFSRVTSGLRIISSGDDAAGLAIANSLRSDRAVLTQGIRNAFDGLSTLQTIDGGINNLSNLLDRARSLAAQSASGTFNGDRSVLNSEFTSVLAEVDRQAQVIGLNVNGWFAKQLSVFIGGGRGVSSTDLEGQITNGSATVDLTRSAVDTTSLGLRGVQAVGATGTDIGPNSTTSLSNILANTGNTTLQPNTTVFVLRGPGFAGSDGIKVSVSTTNLGSTADLAARINSSINNAENAGTQYASALKSAQIRAEIRTDSNGKQQLAFKSSTAAFSVEGGDRMANALMGGFERNAVAVGTDTSATLDTSANRRFHVTIKNATSNVDVDINVTQGSYTSKGQIVQDLNNNGTFASVAEAYLDGDRVAIRSKYNHADSAITLAAGHNLAIGLSTTTAASASTGAAVETRVTAAADVARNTAQAVGTALAGNQTIDATHNTVSLTAGGVTVNNLTLTTGFHNINELAGQLQTAIDASGIGANKVAVSVAGGRLVMRSLTTDSITVNAVANDAYTELGLDGIAGTAITNHYLAASDSAIKLRFQGGGMASPETVTLSATTVGTTTLANLLADLGNQINANANLAAAGITMTTSSAGDRITFTSSSGEKFQVSVTGDSRGVLGFGSFQAGSASGEFDYTGTTAAAAYSTTGGAGTARLQISLNGGASSTQEITANLSGGDAIAAMVTGTDTGATVDTQAGQALAFKINGTLVDVTLANGAAITKFAVVADINARITAVGQAANVEAVLAADGGLRIQSKAKGNNQKIEIMATSSAGVLTELGLAAGTTRGTNATEANVIDQLNDAIQSNSALRSAGLQVTDDAGKIRITSNNNTFFRAASLVTGSDYADIGFGTMGATFAGNAASTAPATTAYTNSSGADMTTQLAFSDLAYGGDDQTVTITATDATGVKHSVSAVLQNDATAVRNGRTLDEALAKINSTLQGTNDSTLQKIVAVKANDGGAEKIQFLSMLKGFEVSVSSKGPGGTGITPVAGNLDKAATVGTGSNVAIDTQAGASAAVSALSTAMSTLGSAQAAVGKGQNQFNYAVNLAQTQFNNLAAAESRIRDADLAAEAANLSKAQILQQAGMAALAQANLVMQVVLGLLRG